MASALQMLKCLRCGYKQAPYWMEHNSKHGWICSNMYKCLVRRMDRVELKIEAIDKAIKGSKSATVS